MELRKPEAFRLFDHNDRCVGYVYADLNHRRCHEDVSVSFSELVNGVRKLIVRHAPVCRYDLSPFWRKVFFILLCYGHGSRESEVLIVLDGGSNHVALPAKLQLLFDKFKGGLVIVAGSGLYFYPPFRLFGDPYDVLVTENGHSKASRDGRCGHFYCMDASHRFSVQGDLLVSSKSLFLVIDDEAEVLILHRFTKTCVGSDYDIYTSVFDAFQILFPLFLFFCRLCVSYKHTPEAKTVTVPPDLLIVLPCENRLRGKDGSLKAVPSCEHEHTGGNYRFSAADVAFNEGVQPFPGCHCLHHGQYGLSLAAAQDVVIRVFPFFFCKLCQRMREHFQITVGKGGIRHYGVGGIRHSSADLSLAHAEQQKVVENKLADSFIDLFKVPGAVDLFKRFFIRKKFVFFPHFLFQYFSAHGDKIVQMLSELHILNAADLRVYCLYFIFKIMFVEHFSILHGIAVDRMNGNLSCHDHVSALEFRIDLCKVSGVFVKEVDVKVCVL